LSNPAEFWKALKDEKPIVIPVNIGNAGKTPAKKVKGTIWVKVLLRDQHVPFGVTMMGKQFDHAIVTPQYYRTLEVEAYEFDVITATPIILKTAVHEALLRGESRIVAFGRFSYVDAWNVEHWVKFCDDLGVNLGGTLRECADYNNMDNNEPKY